MSKLTTLAVWHDLQQHFEHMNTLFMRDLFAQDPHRFDTFSIMASELLLDYSKNIITQETINLLCQLAQQVNLNDKIQQLFSGEKINISEKRAALHTALRANPAQSIQYNGENIIEKIQTNLLKIHNTSHQLRHQQWYGHSNKMITDIVNIGIGGCDLGPAMTCEALQPYITDKLRFHFVSNIDGCHIENTLKHLNPDSTLFIISSKSFSTAETIANATLAKQWLNSPLATEKQLLAITSHRQKARAFGINDEHIFDIWDWVGGRYSIWSAVGLPLAIAIGMEQFTAFLNGALTMDEHFKTANLTKNMPVILALISIWYNNFFTAQTQAILPYAQHLKLLPAYLQQLNMESNGKQVNLEGSPLDYKTAPITWGGVGCNGQHAFHQLFHQSTHLIPIDFIVAINSSMTGMFFVKFAVLKCSSIVRAPLRNAINCSMPIAIANGKPTADHIE